MDLTAAEENSINLVTNEISPSKGHPLNMYVGNLSLGMTEITLRETFIAFGQVQTVSVMNDEYIGSGQRRKYGFVQMNNKNEGIAAISGLHGKTLDGQIITVIEALPLSGGGADPQRARTSIRAARRRL